MTREQILARLALLQAMLDILQGKTPSPKQTRH